MLKMIVYVLGPSEKFSPAFTPDMGRSPPLSVINFIWDTTQGELFEYYDNLIPHWKAVNPRNWSSKFQEVLQEAIDEGTAIIKMRDVCD